MNTIEARATIARTNHNRTAKGGASAEYMASLSRLSHGPRPKWFYFGDMNIECGGYYYNLDNWKYRYVDVWRVVPCSDAGGPNNEFWIEQITVNLPASRSKIWDALLKSSLEAATAYRSASTPQRRHILVDALMSYGTYDVLDSTIVRIGREPDVYTRHADWDETGDKHVLHGKTDLRQYVRRVAKAGNII